MLLYCDFRFGYGECLPVIDTLLEKLGMSVDNVVKHAALAGLGA